MGEPVTDLVMQAFKDELEKIGAPFFKNTFELAGRLGSPLKGLKKGWDMMSPANAMKTTTEVGSDLWKGVQSTAAAGIRGAQGTSTGAQKILDPLRRTFGAGEHLAQPSVPLSVSAGGVRGRAEELSRRGWTGQGAVTKYLPLGEKGQVAIGGLGAADSIARSMDPESKSGPTEAGLSAGAGLGANVLAFGTGGWGLAAPLLATAAGGAIGRRIDGMTQRKTEGTNG